jgi:hypothetical protein
MSTTDIAPRMMILAEFLPLVEQEFLLDATPDEITITLTEAYPLRPNAIADRPPFMLIFRSAADIVLLTGLYVMKAKNFGPDLIHISQTMAPPGDKSGCNFYQATFN